MEKLSVIVVDDEPGIRSGVKRILARHVVSFPFMEDDYGFECTEASSGEEALRLIEAHPPDILLLDNKLPGMTGMELLKVIAQRELDITVAMITSFASLELAAKATDDGARDFIPKPFTPDELKASIDLITKQLFLRRITMKMKEEGKKIRYQFLSLVSHELKSPLNALEGYLHMIRDRELGDDLVKYDSILERSLKRIEGMRSLIMDLLDFTRIRLEKKESRIEKVNLKERAQLALSTIRPLAIQRNIKLSCQGENTVCIQADPLDVDIMLNNLLSNAVKYNRESGSVEVSVSDLGESVEIRVKDTGIGMTGQEVSQLFREFVRIKNEWTQDITGSGLGLSIVSKVCKLYGGHIQVESEPDRGSEFRITLPVR